MIKAETLIKLMDSIEECPKCKKPKEADTMRISHKDGITKVYCTCGYQQEYDMANNPIKKEKKTKKVLVFKNESNFENWKKQIIDKSKIIAEEQPSWRWGQTVFNISEDMYGQARSLVGTPHDCFYSDKKVDEFLKELYKLVEGGEK